ncbi:PREDICTED: fibropellin-1-like [Branchiostoma belcheri]|uniref:Fibropellin-1-like n=1 Tax=Branchiostoma belcheri TaxID=7741 RepID=A0A6P4ZMC6_BRABE|nr:PREDICTED: fibropellin-1-like [Branchiostoma belcheri]
MADKHSVSATESSCVPNPCFYGGVCEDNGDGGYTCTCPAGREGEKCEISAACSGNPCNHGNCTEDPNGYYCACEPGWTGTRCETALFCASQPCQHGGVCIDGANGFYCFCEQGWTGKQCETGAACSGNPCHHGNCTEDPNGYYCACEPGWTGTRCETALFCASQPCQHGGVCIDGANGFYCFCEQGWTGKQCETDIDECKDNPCGLNQQCINHPGNFTCNCTDGYDGTPCNDVDECAANPCQVNEDCINTVGSYTCTCKTGFRPNGDNCEDIDECSFLGRCPDHSNCINTIGSYRCDCHTGFSGPTCTEITTTPPPSTASSTTTTVSGSTVTVTPGTTTLNTFTGSVTTTTAAATTTTTTSGTTATTTTGTTETTTTTQPTPDIGWINGQSVRQNSNGWKVDATMDEKISNASAHQGQQCWYYKSGRNTGSQPGPGDKTPFSPGLSVKVGRSDGTYTAEADSFYVSFWFKMAKDYSTKFGDGTKMLVVAGDPNGTFASSNHLEIYFPSRYRAKVSIQTKESYPSYTECAQSKNCGDNFGGIPNVIADNLDPTTWHHVEMTLRSRPQDYMDEWFYVIDGDTANQKQEGAFYKTQQYDEGRYLYVNRLSFVDITSDAYVSAKKGIYFDDISYKAYNSSNTNVVLKEYSTSFEPVEN